KYLTLREALDDIAGLRMTYLEGALEIMSPSWQHEAIKSTFGRLIELYALERDIDLRAFGSTTYKKQAKERGLEPDECYHFGRRKAVPDIAFEVVLTSGGIDKLAVYQGLGVREVWFWMNGRFALFQLGDD